MNLKKFNLKHIKLDKTKTLILVGLITLLLFVGGATYAYFAFSTADSISGNMNIISNTVDNLIFNVEKDIYINANLENFGQGMADLHDDTDATATLIPNNSTNEATAMYNIYLIIEANDLEYTTGEHTPELLLNVTDPNGTKLENITGLVHHENGFDITTRTGGFLIASDYVINAQDIAEVQTWNVEITLANLDSNQNANMNKTFSAKLYLTQDKMSSYNPVQITNVNATPTYNSIDTTLNLSNGTADAEKYYFGIKEANSEEEVNYNEEDTPNYKFTNLKENTEYTIYSYVVDENDIKSNVYETNITTSEYDLATIDSVEHSVTLNSITLTVNASSGDGTISKYMYSKDNGASWEESNSNTHTFNNLNDTTEYKIKIKVVDSNNRESTEYYEAISTETYILPVVANVEYTTTYNSITLTSSGTDGTNTIDHYEYSIDNGAYQTSNVFSGLNENTEYTINVKAIDSSGRESNPYQLQVTTDTYKVPVISNVTTSSTTNSITINVEASNGDGTITKYMYSRDNGSNWSESTSNSYTFDNLTSNTTFYVQVKAIDNNGRESAVSNATIKTQYLNPIVNSISTSNITQNSITLTINATAGSNSIATYYYSNDNGASYVSSSSNTYTFNNLTPGTTYNFRVYVVDSGGIKSNEATTSATTSYTNPVVNSVTATNVTNDSITVSVSASGGTNAIQTYYYSINNGSYKSSNSNTHTFSGLSAGQSYSIRVYVTDTTGVESNVYTINAETENQPLTLAEACSNGDNLASCITSYYNASGSDITKIYYHNSSLANGAGDNSYRYAGASDEVNNYVCFGSTASPCPSDNLYRIIGVFGNQVKLIKADYTITTMTGSGGDYYGAYSLSTFYYKGSMSTSNIASYYWNYSNSSTNTWSESRLNTTNLNSSYLSYIGSTWSNKIATTTWYVGGHSTINATPATFQDAESTGTTYSAKIGLMYVSDYGFAASPSYWTTNMSSYSNARNNNWMYMGLYEWTISRYSSNSSNAYRVYDSGGLARGNVYNDDYAVRPVFYLTSSITYNRGSGTTADPVRIN